MREDVTERLKALGYEVRDQDGWMLDFVIAKVENEIKDGCNLSDVPEGLREVAVDMAAGEFLMNMKASGQLTGFDLEAPAKQISQGDTSVTYAIGEGTLTPEQRLDKLIASLTTGHKGRFAAYRRVKW